MIVILLGQTDNDLTPVCGRVMKTEQEFNYETIQPPSHHGMYDETKM